MVDIGSYDWNGNLRTAISTSEISKRQYNYTGVDVEDGPNVDLVLHDPYDAWPLGRNSFDIVMSSSALEHDKFFWLTFVKMIEILKPGGYLLFMAPSNMPSHRYPVDSWRFLEDAPDSLLQWARYNKHDVHLVYAEIFPNERFHDKSKTVDGTYTDAVAIYWKSDFTCAPNSEDGTTPLGDPNTCTSEAAQYNAVQVELLTNAFSHLTYSFLRNMVKLGQVGNFAQPSEIANRIALIEDSYKHTAFDVPVSANQQPVQVQVDALMNIQENVVWVEQVALDHILCGFWLPMHTAIPVPTPGSRYIAYNILLQYPQCQVNRSLTLTEECLTHKSVLEKAVTEFASEFQLSQTTIENVITDLWNRRDSLLAHLQSATAVAD